MKCILILPYFGRFKNYFELFLKSCKYNPQMDWLLITDNEDNIVYPENFIIKKMTFKDFRSLVQSKFDFTINLETPYKLCDYKPAYGYICEEWIKGYDYWGHCDCDLIFGDLSPIFNLMEKGYDKLFTGGHLTIYKNSFDNNRVFMNRYLQYGYLYKKVFSVKDIYAFDESCYSINVHSIFQSLKKYIFEDDLAYNVSTKYYTLHRVTYEKQSKRWIEEKEINSQIYWSEGKLYKYSINKGKLNSQEYIYIHLQMRKMKYNHQNIYSSKVIKIEPYEFIGYDNLPTIYEYKKRKKIYINKRVLELFYRRIKKLLKQKKLPIKWIKPWLYNPYE